jgi:hypothetical protein
MLSLALSSLAAANAAPLPAADPSTPGCYVFQPLGYSGSDNQKQNDKVCKQSVSLTGGSAWVKDTWGMHMYPFITEEQCEQYRKNGIESYCGATPVMKYVASQRKCPVTCVQYPVNGTRINHTPDSTTPYNYATSYTHSSEAHSDWKIKVTHNTLDVNSHAWKHHRCYKTTDPSLSREENCACECETAANNNPNLGAVAKAQFPLYPNEPLIPYNPYHGHPDVEHKFGNPHDQHDLLKFWSDRTRAEANAANTIFTSTQSGV